MVCKQVILVDCPSCRFYHSGSKSFYLFFIINQNLNSSLSWYWACLICIYSPQLISYPSKLYTIMQNYFEVISYISWQKSIVAIKKIHYFCTKDRILILSQVQVQTRFNIWVEPKFELRFYQFERRANSV